MKQEYQLLKDLQGYIYHSERTDANGMMVGGFVEYADHINEIINMITKGRKHNPEYDIKPLLTKYPDDFTIEEIIEYFLYLIYREKVDIGTIAKEIENHKFVRLYARYLQLLKNNK